MADQGNLIRHFFFEAKSKGHREVLCLTKFFDAPKRAWCYHTAIPEIG